MSFPVKAKTNMQMTVVRLEERERRGKGVGQRIDVCII